MNLYLLTMSGQGDTHTKLVTENIWKWVFSGDMTGKPPDKNGWRDPTTPPSVRAALLEEQRKENKHWPDDRTRLPEDGLADVTTGSLDNDRALYACGDEVLFDAYAGEETIEDAREWAKKHGHVIVDEWEGYIY